MIKQTLKILQHFFETPEKSSDGLKWVKINLVPRGTMILNPLFKDILKVKLLIEKQSLLNLVHSITIFIFFIE